MIALIDTNVVLDVMLARRSFQRESAAVLAAVEASRCRGLLCAAAITTIHYIASRHVGPAASLVRIHDLMSIFEIAAVNRAVLDWALSLDFSDFEDAVGYNSALQTEANCVVTRNAKDFRQAKIVIYTPLQFIDAIEAATREN